LSERRESKGCPYVGKLRSIAVWVTVATWLPVSLQR
jgi:hypothetical protein